MAQYQIDNIPTPINFGEEDPVQRTLQNAKNLLMCQMGEVPYDRYRGFDPALYDLPIDDMRMELLPELDRIMLYEPDVEVVDAEATLIKDGSTYIKVIVDVAVSEDGENADAE